MIIKGDIRDVSDEYYQLVCNFYPILAKKGIIKAIFRGDTDG